MKTNIANFARINKLLLIVIVSQEIHTLHTCYQVCEKCKTNAIQKN